MRRRLFRPTESKRANHASQAPESGWSFPLCSSALGIPRPELVGSARSAQGIAPPRPIIFTALRDNNDEGSDSPQIVPWQSGSFGQFLASRESWGNGSRPSPTTAYRGREKAEGKRQKAKSTMRRHGAKNADYRGGVTCLYDTQLLGACLHAYESGGRYHPAAVRSMPEVSIEDPSRS